MRAKHFCFNNNIFWANICTSKMHLSPQLGCCPLEGCDLLLLIHCLLLLSCLSGSVFGPCFVM